ncbi:hypothetical protein ACVWXU_004574 [Streptomyces sp. TE33382]
MVSVPTRPGRWNNRPTLHSAYRIFPGEHRRFPDKASEDPCPCRFRLDPPSRTAPGRAHVLRADASCRPTPCHAPAMAGGDDIVSVVGRGTRRLGGERLARNGRPVTSPRSTARTSCRGHRPPAHLQLPATGHGGAPPAGPREWPTARRTAHRPPGHSRPAAGARPRTRTRTPVREGTAHAAHSVPDSHTSPVRVHAGRPLDGGPSPARYKNRQDPGGDQRDRRCSGDDADHLGHGPEQSPPGDDLRTGGLRNPGHDALPGRLGGAAAQPGAVRSRPAAQ